MKAINVDMISADRLRTVDCLLLRKPPSNYILAAVTRTELDIKSQLTTDVVSLGSGRER